jgi:hypothetical protein
MCPSHRGHSWSHHPRSRATLGGLKAKLKRRPRPKGNLEGAARDIIKAGAPHWIPARGPLYGKVGFATATRPCYRSPSVPGGTIGTLPGVMSEISAGAPYSSINSAARRGEGTSRV